MLPERFGFIKKNKCVYPNGNLFFKLKTKNELHVPKRLFFKKNKNEK